MIPLKINIGDKHSLEELFKDCWKEIGTFGYNLHLGKCGERILYDREKGEVVFKYEHGR